MARPNKAKPSSKPIAAVHPAANFNLRRLNENDLSVLLELYRACEDFLALGPHPLASEAMVLADLALSRATGGTYCGIFDGNNRLVGVADWISSDFEGDPATAFIELLMIAAPCRKTGLGHAVEAEIEKHIRREGRARRIDCGVQINNLAAQRFWLRCGYRSTGPPQKFPDGTTAIRMRKELHGSA